MWNKTNLIIWPYGLQKYCCKKAKNNYIKIYLIII